MTATVVDGKKVIADEGAPSPVGNGLTFKSIRTLLLDDGSTIFGCVDCDYTAEKTGSVRSHRVKHAKKPRRPAVGSKSSTVVGLARELERLSSELEQVGEDRDRWKARATKAERSLETLRRALRAD